MRILIAEDDRVSALVLRRTLERMGHVPAVASDGFEALDLFEREPFSVVISDWMMPGLDGLALCERIRRMGTDRYTYLMLLTARSQREDRLLALESGVDDFLTKPLDSAELAARLKVVERIMSWQTQLQEVNQSLLASATAIAKQAAELDEMRRKAEFLASHDPLTGVLSRGAWFAAAEGTLPSAVAVFDVDHFKLINDKYGHPAGDGVLRGLAERLVSATSRTGCVGRLGGEEFGALFTGTFEEAAEESMLAVERISSEPFTLANGKTLHVTVSAGLAPCVRTIGTNEQAVALAYDQADRALYEAKTRGRRRLVVSSLAA